MSKAILFYLMLSTSVFGQPLFQLPPGNYTCSVEIHPHQSRGEATSEQTSLPIPKKRIITQVGDFRKDEVIWTDNSSLQFWMLRREGLAVSEQKGSDGRIKAYVLTGTLRDSVFPAILRFDASSLAWITPDNLVKESSAASDGPLHYRAEIHRPAVRAEFRGMPDTPALTVTYQAWIDRKTLLPIRLDDGEAAYVLQFEKAAPVGPLVMPEHLAVELKRWASAMATHSHL